MNAGRRTVLALLGAGVLARPSWAQGRTITDSAGRKIVLPDRISRVFVAGPSASILVYTLAPDMMVGWVRAPTAAEKEFLTAAARDLPETGRLTGRGDTVSLERLVAAKPDLDHVQRHGVIAGMAFARDLGSLGEIDGGVSLVVQQHGPRSIYPTDYSVGRRRKLRLRRWDRRRWDRTAARR